MLYSLPRSFDAWERLPSRTSRSAFAYAHVKADWIDLCHPCWSVKKLRVLERVQPGDTEYIPAHAVCTVDATTSSAAASNVKATSVRLPRGGGACIRRQECGAGQAPDPESLRPDRFTACPDIAIVL
jgi:hypothetical protein